MDRAHLGYRQGDNCFVWIEDYAQAQKLMDQQLRLDWAALMKPTKADISAEGAQLLPESLLRAHGLLRKTLALTATY